MPAVSVIVLVYKVEEYIERCARHLFDQTLEDIEYIFVDDCSPDRSVEILERVLDDYPHRSKQVQILHNDVNRGQAFSRRRGIEAATGEYIIHCDSDDWPEMDMYEKMYVKASEENLDMVICNIRRIYQDHVELVPDKLGAEDLLGALIRQDIYHYLLNKLVSRRAYEKGITFPSCNLCEDTAIIIQLACNCDSFGYVYEPLYNYLYREDSISSAKNTVAKIEQLKSNVDLAVSSLEARGLSRQYKDDITSLKCWAKVSAQQLPWKYYVKMYPEVTVSSFFDRRMTTMERLGHLTKLLGIHGISKPFVRKK